MTSMNKTAQKAKLRAEEADQRRFKKMKLNELDNDVRELLMEYEKERLKAGANNLEEYLNVREKVNCADVNENLVVDNADLGTAYIKDVVRGAENENIEKGVYSEKTKQTNYTDFMSSYHKYGGINRSENVEAINSANGVNKNNDENYDEDMEDVLNTTVVEKEVSTENIILETQIVEKQVVEIRTGLTMKQRAKELQMKALDTVIVDSLPAATIKEIMNHIAGYQNLILDLLIENEGLKGKLENVGNEGKMNKQAPKNMPTTKNKSMTVMGKSAAKNKGNVARTAANSGITATKPKPKKIATWSLVVKGKGKVAPENIAEKVIKEVGPSINVRVVSVKPLKNGGAIITTPSIAERDAIRNSEKLKGCDLEVTTNDKLGQLLCIKGVPTEISPETFMKELYEKNLKEHMSPEAFSRETKLINKPWSAAEKREINVVIDASGKIGRILLEAGRVFVMWSSFWVRKSSGVSHCYRCLGLGHKAIECRSKDDHCIRCGQEGHLIKNCKNAVNCRSCAIKRKPAGHYMLSMSYPLFRSAAEKSSLRH